MNIISLFFASVFQDTADLLADRIVPGPDWRGTGIRSEVAREIRLIPSAEMGTFVTQVMRLINIDTYASDRLEITMRMRLIPAAERNTFIAQVMQATTIGRRWGDDQWRCGVIYAVSDIPAEERGAFITQSMRLVTENTRSDLKWSLIYKVRWIPAAEREAVITQTKRFVNENIMGEEALLCCIETVQSISSAERETVITQAMRLITQNMTAAERKRIILGIKQQIPANRDAIVGRAYNQLLVDFPPDAARPDHHRYFSRIIELLETPLNQPIPPLNQANHAAQNAAVGINVHNGNRDQFTRQGIELLKLATGDVTDVEIEQAKNSFINYLEAFQDNTIKTKALEAVRDGAVGSLFGPLLPDDTFTIYGLRIPGKEVVARFWRFIENYNDPNGNIELERNNAKIAMVQTLSRCFEGNGKLVCNPGKVQRLAVAVLQGRLAGVDIDEIQEALVIPTNQAITLFFSLEWRQQLSLDPNREEELIAEAMRFCNENPLIDRETFLAEVRQVHQLNTVV